MNEDRIKEIINKVKDKVITKVDFDEAQLIIHFEDESFITVVDWGQSCCESRYITCDDDVNSIVGSKLMAIDLIDGSEQGDGIFHYHQYAFVDVKTDLTSIKLCTHNEHNGYYGGFSINVIYDEKDSEVIESKKEKDES
jgi:hypothetical protein